MGNHSLDLLRKQIDTLDMEIVRLLAQRMGHVSEVGYYKKKHRIVPLDESRWQEVLQSRLRRAQELGVDQDLVKGIYELIHKTALETEVAIQKGQEK